MARVASQASLVAADAFSLLLDSFFVSAWVVSTLSQPCLWHSSHSKGAHTACVDSVIRDLFGLEVILVKSTSRARSVHSLTSVFDARRGRVRVERTGGVPARRLCQLRIMLPLARYARLSSARGRLMTTTAKPGPVGGNTAANAAAQGAGPADAGGMAQTKPQPHWLEVWAHLRDAYLCATHRGTSREDILPPYGARRNQIYGERSSERRALTAPNRLSQVYYLASCICAVGTGVALWVEGTRKSKRIGACRRSSQTPAGQNL